MTNLPLPRTPVQDPDCQANWETVQLRWPGNTGTVTALPTAPQDGQEISYVADATNGVVWRFKYRAASASASKWEFIGGAPLVAQNDTGATPVIAVAFTFVDPANNPTLTVPLSGDYEIAFGCTLNNQFAGVNQMLYRTANAAGAAVTQNIQFTATAQFQTASPWAEDRIVGLTAGVGLKAQLTGQNAGATVTVTNKRIRLTPVRVG